MTKHLVLFAVSAALATGCGRPNDVARMQDEATGIVDRAKPEIAALQHRIAMVKLRAPAFRSAPDYQKADYTVGEATHELDQLVAELAKRPTEIAAVTSGSGDARLATDELQKIADETHESVRAHILVATVDVATAETWLARSAALAATPAAPPPPPPAPEAASTPTTPPPAP